MVSDSSSKPPISRVLAHYYGINITATRGRQKVCCPLHADENPSASVNVDASRWNCFACNLSEDSFDVIMREEGVSFAEAKERAHSEFGGSSSDVSPDVPGEPSGGVHQGPRPGRGSGGVRTGVRRFGATWS
ncbi:CHC2 zinc finger domain-containing protein [Streptomyces flavofungini]|uniref:CHC2 zinc finger domain-containing protein n=1 Tax=Streptomyces flavofungini TaxID=68200 RepID=UPI00339D4832